ncbi:hypothetical protein [Aliivibrio fischeri]|uniref:hypothetical protein n=1 Tax=Aliivibrio fischeri TaxID=668 RepID=UPI0037370C73
MVTNYIVLIIFFIAGLFLITKEVKENYVGTLTELSGIKHKYTVTIIDYKKIIVNETIYGLSGFSNNVCLFSLNHIEDNKYVLLNFESYTSKSNHLKCDGFFNNLSMIKFYQDRDGLFLENDNTYLFLKKLNKNRLR